MSSHQTFKALHQQRELFVLANAWNPGSAKLFEQSGFKAIGTSSSALAESLGYADGENIPVSDVLFIAERIVKAVNVPVTIDLEGGYGKTAADVIKNISQLFDAGVVGINFEDSLVAGKRGLLEVGEFARKIEFIKDHLSRNNMPFFINVRTDAFLLRLSNPLQTTLDRLPAYESAGADGIFVPCIVDKNDITAVVKGTSLPINVMSMPALPDFATLSSIGVKRVSMGDFAYSKVYRGITSVSKRILQEQSTAAFFQD